jgi:hypothetical protein
MMMRIARNRPDHSGGRLSVVVLSVMVVCLINDTVKVALVKRFWQQL